MGLIDRAVGVVGEVLDAWRARPRGLRPDLPNPATNRTWFYPGYGSVGLPYVTEAAVLGLPAAGRAVRLIANAVAAMAPPRALLADGVTELDTVPPVVARPNATYAVSEWWSMAIAHYLVTGNLVALHADPDPFTGWPRQVVPVNSALVHCYYDDAGFVRYDIGDLTGIPASSVLHVRAYVIPGNPWGIGAIEAYRRSIGLALDQTNMAAAQYQSGGIPSGILKPGLVDTSRSHVEAIQDRWVERFSGGNRRPAVMPDDWEFQPLAWSPEDMEFLSARAFTVAEIALMFDLDPADLGSSFGSGSNNLTYANLSQRQSARVVDSYGPHIARFEDAWSDLLPGGTLVRFRRENLTHASRRELFEEQKLGIDAGVLSEDEARAELNKPPLPKPDPPDVPIRVPSVTGPPEPAELDPADVEDAAA